MSELSAAAAAALGIPEAIVERSAAARAEETGMTVDEVLAAWAGGGDIPAPTPPPTSEETAAPVDEEESPLPASGGTPPSGGREESPLPASGGTPPSGGREESPLPPSGATPPSGGRDEAPPAEQRDIPVPAAQGGMAPTTASGKPPVLVGESDNPITVLVGVVALFVAVFLVGLVGPALPAENPGARSSDLPYSEPALRGQVIYQSVGCASCHTQMVRPVVADVDLGAVTLNDSNQVLGTRRFGPDLSDIGSRMSGSQIEAVIAGLGDHPSLALAPEDIDDLVTYLLESRTSVDSPAGDPTGEEPTEEEPAGS